MVTQLRLPVGICHSCGYDHHGRAECRPMCPPGVLQPRDKGFRVTPEYLAHVREVADYWGWEPREWYEQ